MSISPTTQTTITLVAGVSQEVLAANGLRVGMLIQNLSDRRNIRVKFGAAPIDMQDGMILAPGHGTGTGGEFDPSGPGGVDYFEGAVHAFYPDTTSDPTIDVRVLEYQVDP